LTGIAGIAPMVQDGWDVEYVLWMYFLEITLEEHFAAADGQRDPLVLEDHPVELCDQIGNMKGFGEKFSCSGAKGCFLVPIL
jgi:hypothetical protein